MDQHIEKPASQGSPPLGSLGTELARIQQRGLWIGLGLGFVVGLTGPVLVFGAIRGVATRDTAVVWIWLAAAVCIGSLLLGTAIAAFLPPLLLSSRDRAASAVHSWVGAREVRRLFGTPRAAMGIPTNAPEAEHWLATQPDTPHLLPLRFEMLLLTRRFDEARAAIERFPRASAMDEYRITEAHAIVDDQQSGQADILSVQDALTRIPHGVDRSEAAASLAVFEARRMLGRGDWRAPLVAARSQVPGSDLAILTRDLGLPVFQYLVPRVVLPIAGLILAIAAVVTFMALT